MAFTQQLGNTEAYMYLFVVVDLLSYIYFYFGHVLHIFGATAEKIQVNVPLYFVIQSKGRILTSVD